MDAEDSDSSLSEVSSLDADFDTMHLESDSSDEEVTDEDIDSHTWNKIEPESDAEFVEDHGLIEDVTPISKDDTINPIDCYRHFITDEIIDLMVRETNRYAEQYLQSHEISRRSMFHQWKPTTNEEMLKFFGIIIEMTFIQMPKLKYYWSSSKFQQDPIAGLQHSETVVVNLLDGLLGCYRTVHVDNFFTSISLATRLLEDDTYLIRTLRSNRAGSGNEVRQKKLRRGEVYGRKNRDGIKLIMWKDKRDVLMISTRPSHSATLANTGKTSFQNERIMKPKVVLDYNRGRQGIDFWDSNSQ
ncbi:unnamed protein product [Adineta ricciae]|uniref:PiggyBac transposable element-derived protein domain-containing protein n=1 Tax=Adineta ricciae TaxID=249248 RepID=A0A816A562_ADIRI|nr:unnamed protein product [Adineta ricciae]CAF1591644.1 unnamed protein product [Adineta ricciae]